MKSKEDNPLFDKNIQKILNKLISEEVIASQFYIGCIAAACKCQSSIFNNMFVEISNDELNDHCKNLCEWARDNDYSVPYKFKEYEKYAASSTVKQFDNLKSDQEASYYVNEAIKSEEDAIKSYEDARKYEDIPQELDSILLQNYYDEIEHLRNLQSLKMAVDGQAQLATW